MLQKIKNRQPQAGFTLVELLIVIVVIAILAAIAITAFAGVQAKARDAQRQADIKQVASQLELYYTDNGNYPASIGATTFKGLGEDALVSPQAASGTSNSFGTANPAAGSDVYFYQAYTDDGDGTACTSAAVANCQSFVLKYWSETKQGGAGLVTVKDVSGD